MPEKNKIIPNSFQFPNFYVDNLWTYLTPEECKVLTFAIREILGWQDRIASRKAFISLSVFTEGKEDKKGERYNYGCGLSRQAVIRALNSLNEFCILKKAGFDQRGQLYHLETDWINWEALDERKAKWRQEGLERTAKARSLIPQVVSPTNHQVVSPTNQGGQSHIPPVVSPTNPYKPRLNPDIKRNIKTIWADALINLKNTMAESTYNAHLLDTKPVSMDNGRLVIRAQGYSLDWLRLRLGDQINQAVSAAAGREVTVEYQEEGS